MQAKLFGYTVERSVGGAVFEVADPAGEPRLLLEWTPPAGERDAARQRLEAAAVELQAQVFTADASLYLVVRDRREAAEALRVLQRRELFGGNWLEAPAQPVAVAAPPVIPTVPASQPLAAPFRQVPQAAAPPRPAPQVIRPAPPAAPARKSSKGKGCLLAFLGFVLFVATWSISDRFVIAAVVLVVYSILLPRLLKLWSGV